MIQDIKPKQLLNQYKNQKITDKDYVLFFKGREILLNTVGELQYLTYSEAAEICATVGMAVPECRFLFNVDEESYFLAETFEVEESLIAEFARWGYEFYRMYDLRRRQPKEAVFAGVTAWHLFDWYRVSHFCGACGKEIDAKAVACPFCGARVSDGSEVKAQTKFCSNCGQKIDINAVVCPHCGVSAKNTDKSPVVALLLTLFVLTGLGQFYLGLNRKGIITTQI